MLPESLQCYANVTESDKTTEQLIYQQLMDYIILRIMELDINN
jgi:hypothetical protein